MGRVNFRFQEKSSSNEEKPAKPNRSKIRQKESSNLIIWNNGQRREFFKNIANKIQNKYKR
jgi:hypothetical protein